MLLFFPRQNTERRSGRPTKHPLPIPIPAHMTTGKRALIYDSYYTSTCTATTAVNNPRLPCPAPPRLAPPYLALPRFALPHPALPCPTLSRPVPPCPALPTGKLKHLMGQLQPRPSELRDSKDAKRKGSGAPSSSSSSSTQPPTTTDPSGPPKAFKSGAALTAAATAAASAARAARRALKEAPPRGGRAAAAASKSRGGKITEGRRSSRVSGEEIVPLALPYYGVKNPRGKKGLGGAGKGPAARRPVAVVEEEGSDDGGDEE